MKNLIRHNPEESLPIPRQRTSRKPALNPATSRKRSEKAATRERAQARRLKSDPLRTVNSLLMALTAATVILSSLAGTVQ